MKQTAFMGRPLYYFSDDAKPGDVKGQGFNDVWYVANITGTIPVVTPQPHHGPDNRQDHQPLIWLYGGGY